MPHLVSEHILNNFQINGAQPITLDSIRTLIGEMLNAENGPIVRILQQVQTITVANNNINHEAQNNGQVAVNNGNQWFQWGGRYHR